MGILYKRVFWPDTHCPKQDNSAVNCAIEIARDIRPDELVFLGDFQDCAGISAHSKTPEEDWMSLQQELGPGIELMHEIVRKTRAKRIVFLSGNHERRIQKYIDEWAPKLHGLLNTPDVLGIPNNWEYKPYGNGNYHACGNSGVIAVHGSLLGQFPTKRVLDKYRCNGIVFGHTHKLQAFYQTNVFGETQVAISGGHLANERELAGYVDSVADWQQGLTAGYFKRSGRRFLEMIHINSGEAVFHGRYYNRRSRRGVVV